MSAQYDNIGTAYDEMKKFPVALLERANVKTALAPYIKGANVLDLACGTGYYCQKCLEWGAARVTGVDISKTMIAAAQKATADDARVSFQVADCSVPIRHDGGPFDIVLGSWLLNYASCREEMVRMHLNIAMNLKDGGRFIGVTPDPTDDPKTRIEEVLAADPPPHPDVTVTVKSEIQDGVETHLVARTKAGEVEFDGYMLRKAVYEESARQGGMLGPLMWKPTNMPEKLEDRPYGLDEKAWEAYMKLPHFCILDLSKN
ncbi:hypothetical protein ACLMJK_008707 [Lecanora helva]